MCERAVTHIVARRARRPLHYAALFKQDEHAIDKDEVYADLQRHFSDKEIIKLGTLCANRWRDPGVRNFL